MNLTFECPNCRTPQRAYMSEQQPAATCVNCSHVFPPHADSRATPTLNECFVCGTEDLYVEKDFPHRLGISIVIVGGILSSIAWWQYWYPTAIGVLLVTALLDLCLYYSIGDVLVCYRCLAQYRGVTRNPNHKQFDLGVGERYRQERMRVDLLRATHAKPATVSPGNEHH